MAVDGLLALAFILAFGVLIARNPFHFVNTHPEVLLMPGVYILFLHLGGLYDVRRRWSSGQVLLKAGGMSFLAVLFYHSLHVAVSRAFVAEGMSVSLSFGMALGVTVVRGVFLPRLRKKIPMENAVVFGCGWGGCEALDSLKRMPWSGVRPVGIIDDSPAKRNFVYRDIPVLGTRDSLREVVRSRDVGIVINAAPRVGNDELIAALSNGSITNVRVVELETFYEQTTGRLMLQERDGAWTLREGDIEPHPEQEVGGMKRVRDFCYALVTVMIAAPLLVSVAVLLKVFSRRTVLTREEMAGLGGAPFYRLSFRTGGEPRMPWMARPLAFLQKMLILTRLRELPMLLNVLRGDMSFFGPVPESPEFVGKARQKNPLYGLRLRVRPGLVGWAEINLMGRNYPADHVERLGYDLYYVKNVSSRLDLKILAGLFKTVFLSPERI